MLTPKSETELAQLITNASDPLHVFGGGTRPIGSTAAGTKLSTAALTGIELYEPGALTIVAKAGTPLEEITSTLDAENQILPFEPMDHRGLLGTSGTPTIGGVVAANVSGPRRVQAGACRDSLIGVRFVDGQGTVLKNGGRVMKNVTGYDLVKLMAGSYGTLGVLTEVAFKVLPRPDATASLVFEGLDVDQAVAAMSDALSSPFEVSGAAHVIAEKRTILRLEGFDNSVRYRLGQLAGRLDRFGAAERITDSENARKDWAEIANVTALCDPSQDLWRISVKPSDAPAVVTALPDPDRATLDWGGGLIWAETPPGFDLRGALTGIPGHATCLRSHGEIATFHPEPAPVAALSRGLREKFDPRGILNPGMME